MKKTILLCLVSVALATGAMAQDSTVTTTTTTTTHQAKQMRFYYYPGSNVYFNPTANNYWYWDDANSQWTSVTELPATVHLVKTNRVVVYRNDADIWKDNAEHVKKYKIKKDGTIKPKG